MEEEDNKKHPLGRDLTGEDFAGYRIGAKIGAGGYAWVFRATDVELGRDVALKILIPRRGGYPSILRERFFREAKLVARLKDPRSINLIEHGEEEGLLYIAFEYIEGQSLEEWLEEGKPMGALRTAKIVEQILESLADAHHLGIVHRDIKPGNIMLYELAGRADQVKVLDFGIGKFVDQKVTRNLTREGGWLGTPRYMAPEQVRGGGVSAASDIYAVGLVGYELLTGQRAISAEDAMEAVAEIASDENLQVPHGTAPKALAAVVNKMLHKDVKRRYQSAVDVLVDLQSLRRDTGELSSQGPKIRFSSGARFLRGKKAKISSGVLGLIVFGLVVWGVKEGPVELSQEERVAQFEEVQPPFQNSENEEHLLDAERFEDFVDDDEIAIVALESERQEPEEEQEEELEELEEVEAEPEEEPTLAPPARVQRVKTSQIRPSPEPEPEPSPEPEPEPEPEPAEIGGTPLWSVD